MAEVSKGCKAESSSRMGFISQICNAKRQRKMTWTRKWASKGWFFITQREMASKSLYKVKVMPWNIVAVNGLLAKLIARDSSSFRKVVCASDSSISNLKQGLLMWKVWQRGKRKIKLLGHVLPVSTANSSSSSEDSGRVLSSATKSIGKDGSICPQWLMKDLWQVPALWELACTFLAVLRIWRAQTPSKYYRTQVVRVKKLQIF